MQFVLGVFDTVVNFFQNIGNFLSLEYMLYTFVGIELFMVLIFAILASRVYEIRLLRAVDKINAYLYHNPYIEETNLIEFNNKMKKVPKVLRYHWQQFMLYREKSPSYYMSIENCIDIPIKSSFFESIIRIVKSLGFIIAAVALVLSCGTLASMGVDGSGFYVSAFAIPAIVLLINGVFTMALQIKKSSNLSDLYQTFHIFNRFIDKAVTTLPEYVDYEVLFTRAEIKKGIPVLNEYIEKRQIQEQEEMKKARLNAVDHEQYNFDSVGDKGNLVLERAMKETETFINMRFRLNAEIEQLENEMDGVKRSYDNKTKEYQRNLQTVKENIERLKEEIESSTNRVATNYIRKQQTDEIKKKDKLENDQQDATMRFNQEINSLNEEIDKRKQELEEGRKYVETAMLSEYKTFASKIFKEIREDVNKINKNEKEELISSKEMITAELEAALSDVERLEQENKELKLQLGLDVSEETSEEKQKKNEERENKATELLNKKNKGDEPEYDEYGGYYDEEGYYRYANGTYYDPEGNFHDEFGGIVDVNGNYIKPETQEIIEPVIETKPEEVVVKKSKGRPKKVVEKKKPAGKRGRPKKEVKEQPEGEKRGRGRPKKEATEEKKPAGRRGRPKKENVKAKPEGEKRGRGRPKKEKVEVKPEKRGRGRPKKQTNLDEDLKKINEKLRSENEKFNKKIESLNEILNSEDVDSDE